MVHGEVYKIMNIGKQKFGKSLGQSTVTNISKRGNRLIIEAMKDKELIKKQWPTKELELDN